MINNDKYQNGKDKLSCRISIKDKIKGKKIKKALEMI